MSIKGFNINGNIEKVDYNSLENIPFGSEYKKATDILETKEYEFSDMDYTAGVVIETTLLLPINADTPYNFTFDGESYTIVFSVMEGIYVAGNLSIADMGSPTEEPFIIGIMDWEKTRRIMVYTNKPVGTYVMGLSYIGDDAPIVEVVHKIDEKYIKFPFDISNNRNVNFENDVIAPRSEGDKENFVSLRKIARILVKVQSMLQAFIPYSNYGEWDRRFIVLRSSSTSPDSGFASSKLFRISVDDSGTLTATEFTESDPYWGYAYSNYIDDAHRITPRLPYDGMALVPPYDLFEGDEFIKGGDENE